ncbi:MAG: SGNH/GDSL hydrolase family protein [Alphaproteobacteria bacterium]|nr:SGNH/GDSL hydrolase family protein [Alphaproteobacteria bacterium]
MLRDRMQLRPPAPALLRRQHSLMALTLLGLVAAGLLLFAPAGRRAEAKIDRCGAGNDQAALDMQLPHVAQALKAARPVVVVAFGSSSTYGTGASALDKTYPSRLAALLARRFPHAGITVLNRGVSGESAAATLVRVDSDVIAAHPALVIWQIGTNDVLRDVEPAAAGEVIRKGVLRMQQAGIDVVLMDVQFAPAVLRHLNFREMERVIAAEGRALDVPVIHRFAMMREWAEERRMPFSVMLGRDHLHMTDASYDCLARQVGRSIALAARATFLEAYGVNIARP